MFAAAWMILNRQREEEEERRNREDDIVTLEMAPMYEQPLAIHAKHELLYGCRNNAVRFISYSVTSTATI